MSATRNPYYQLTGGADLPGDVRVSDTADSTKTSADGWAASPAAVANAVPEMEYGCYLSGIISDKSIRDYDILFRNSHKSKPKTVLMTYSLYGYCYGYLHLHEGKRANGVDNAGFTATFIPAEIGAGQGNLFIHWLAIW